MNLFDKLLRMSAKPDTFDETMYQLLKDKRYNDRPYQKESIGDGMSMVYQLFGEWWKPRYLVDGKAKCAYEFMDGNECLTTVTADDIDWESLKGLPTEAIGTAKRLSFHYPSFVRTYQNGVAEVSWQLNPDGRYYMDDDGFGMTDDEEITIYGFVDRTGKPLTKFRYVEDLNELKEMRRQAENKIASDSLTDNRHAE